MEEPCHARRSGEAGCRLAFLFPTGLSTIAVDNLSLPVSALRGYPHYSQRLQECREWTCTKKGLLFDVKRSPLGVRKERFCAAKGPRLLGGCGPFVCRWSICANRVSPSRVALGSPSRRFMVYVAVAYFVTPASRVAVGSSLRVPSALRVCLAPRCARRAGRRCSRRS